MTEAFDSKCYLPQDGLTGTLVGRVWNPAEGGPSVIVAPDDGVFDITRSAPTQDRDAPGEGYTHKLGDSVAVSTPKLGALVNRVTRSDHAPAWEFGTLALMRNLTARRLL